MTMLDPLPSWSVRVHRLDPGLAELHIRFADLPPDVEVRGRLMGPRWPGVSTIEVAYHLRPVSAPPASVYRVLIPEPVTWADERPCVYEGPVEFRRAGEEVGKVVISIGIKAPSGG
jgi:hypothetical protein